MSRIAKRPIIVPDNVCVKINNKKIIISGKNGTLYYVINKQVEIIHIHNTLIFKGDPKYHTSWIQAGTSRSIIHSMILGVTIGFTKKLILLGVGYRVSIDSKNILNLSLGFSHPVFYKLPKDVHAEILSQTELVLHSANKQLLGQVSANIRLYRKPEPYKGKGIRYEDEIIRIKEAKKK